MCTVSKEKLGRGFIITNAVMNQKEPFDIDSLQKSEPQIQEYPEALIVRHLNRLIDLGFIYKKGHKFVLE